MVIAVTACTIMLIVLLTEYFLNDTSLPPHNYLFDTTNDIGLLALCIAYVVTFILNSIFLELLAK